jgi:hypothetical protein
MAHETRTLIVETAIAAPFETVWRALRDPAEIRRWHGWEYDGLDDEIEAIYVSGATASKEDGTIDLTEVGTRFGVERHGSRTIVRVTKAAPAGEGFDEIDEGWITFFNQLRFYLERHPGQDRRTLHSGGAEPPLGFDAAGSAKPGERWEATAPWGEPLGGEVIHRTPHQVGLSVDDWNDAMLVLYRRGRVIVGTYGLDETRLAEIRERFAER